MSVWPMEVITIATCTGLNPFTGNIGGYACDKYCRYEYAI